MPSSDPEHPLPRRLSAPSALATLLELRAPLDSLSLALRWPALLSAPRGDGRTILLLPGFQASPLSMTPIRRYLRYLGYAPQHWSLGRNRGNVEDMVERLKPDVIDLAARSGRPIATVGWSLGGVVARELARDLPDAVSDVVTFGTPVAGGPKYTAVARRFEQSRYGDLDAFEDMVHARNLDRLRQPVTSIYSRGDGIVGWRASVDGYNPQARNIEVSGSHLGLGVNASVWSAVAEALAEHAVAFGD